MCFLIKEGNRLKTINLLLTNLNKSINRNVYKSIGKQTTLYEIVFLPNEGLGSHIHTSGEDCAFVLSGKLNYFVSNKDTIISDVGEAVFGWKQVIHGYLNNYSEPLHLLVFVTPGKVGLAYPGDSDPSVRHFPYDQRKINCNFKDESSQSEFSSFSSLTIKGTYQEKKEEGLLKVFVDWKKKKIYVFDNEDVHLEIPESSQVLRYLASS